MTPPTSRVSPWPALVRLFGRYGLVGLLATAAHWGLLALLVETGAAPAWLASGAGALLGAQVAFVGNRWFTFGAHAAARSAWWPQWWKFMLTAALGGLLGMAIVAVLVAAGAHYLLAQAVATLASLLLTFAVNRRWSFAAPAQAGSPALLSPTTPTTPTTPTAPPPSPTVPAFPTPPMSPTRPAPLVSATPPASPTPPVSPPA